MRVNYPWLQDPYYEDKNESFSKRNFLKKIDNFVNQRQYVKITLLNWNERPLKDIQGEISSGSLTKDGSSAVRRTCNLACSVSRGEYSPAAMSADYSINKKIFLEIGIKNETDQYTEYPILWFPQGVFFITSFSITSSSSSSINISLGLKDKMAMLDGTISGKFPSTVILDTEETQTVSGQIIEQKVRLCDLIVELVNHFGGEQIPNIVVEDVPEKIGRCLRWIDSEHNFYIYYDNNSDNYSVSNEEEEVSGSTILYRTCECGDDIGYVYEDLVYTSDLTVAAGSTITAALDTIKNYLGNYEYFYDEYGVFHFREIRNYLNNSMSSHAISEMSEYDYLMETASMEKSVYTFSDDTNLISITNTPQYENIRNDFIVHGTKKSTSTNLSYDVMYHLAIDTKPEIKLAGYSNILVYKDPSTNYDTLTMPIILTKAVLEETVGDANFVYGYLDETDDEELTFEVEYTLEELQDLNAEGMLGSTLAEKTNDIFENISDEDDDYTCSQKSLINKLTFLVETFLDLDMDETTAIDNYAYQNIEKYKQSIYDNTCYEEIVSGMTLQASKLDSLISTQATILKNLTDDTAIQEICDNIISRYGESDVDIDSNKYENVIKSLNNQISTCNALIESYQKMDATKYADNITALQTEVTNLTKQISWYQARKLLQTNVTDDNENASYPKKEVVINLARSRFFYWKDMCWEPIDWSKYYPGGTYYYINNDTDFEYETLKDEYDEDNPDKIINMNKEYNYAEESGVTTYVAKDWRTEIILQGLQAKFYGTDNNSYYYEELISHWPTIYNLQTQNFRGLETEKDKQYKSLCDGYYFLDIIDSSSGVYGDYSVSNIGRRNNVTISTDINCLFEPDTPNIGYVIYSEIAEDVLSEEDFTTAEEQTKKTILENGLSIVDIPIDRTDLTSYFATGGLYNGAFPQIKYDLLTHTKYQNTISISAIPAWYLEPNSRIQIADNSTNTFGEYMIQSISYTLGAGNPMTVNCSEITEKI